MPFRIVLSRSAAKELDSISTKFHDKIIERLRAMEHDPRSVASAKLTAFEAYKLRI
jgi:mRNA-degrading endonuclease RelE of RelBE toxin-antitoxin system